uniref:Uncharacterized protein n=1 Tax=Solanum tuberosum TaxID=4113 RepID=M1DFE7_SOLTU
MNEGYIGIDCNDPNRRYLGKTKFQEILGLCPARAAALGWGKLALKRDKSGVAFRHTNLNRLPRFGIIMGSVATFRHNIWIGYHIPINEALDVDPGYLYLHHKRCRPNGISTLNVRACEGKTKNDISLN